MSHAGPSGKECIRIARKECAKGCEVISVLLRTKHCVERRTEQLQATEHFLHRAGRRLNPHMQHGWNCVEPPDTGTPCGREEACTLAAPPGKFTLHQCVSRNTNLHKEGGVSFSGCCSVTSAWHWAAHQTRFAGVLQHNHTTRIIQGTAV